MAAKVFFLFVTVLVLFESQAALYRRVFAGPGSPFMRDLIEYDDPISRRGAMPDDSEDCRDLSPGFCRAWEEQGYCNRPEYYARRENFRTFTEVFCRRTCGRCHK